MNFQERDKQQKSDFHSFKMVVTSDLSRYTSCRCLILL